MLKVGVVGGGRAGTAAALEAAGRGASVILFERRPSPLSDESGDAVFEPAGVALLRGQDIVNVGPGPVLMTSDRKSVV